MMRVSRNSANSVITSVVLAHIPEPGIKRWVGWTHLSRRVKERVFPKASQEQIILFMEDIRQLVATHLAGKVCIKDRFILKMGTFGWVCTFQSGVLTIHTILRIGGWVFNESLFASGAIGADLADTTYSQLYGLYLDWKNRLR